VQSAAPIIVQEAEPEIEEEKIQFSVTRFDEEKEELEAPPAEIAIDLD
jgi:hypothetical protein